MPITALLAHFDGEQICLDEPFEIEPNTKLIVTILPKHEINDEYRDWLLLSRQKLEDAYGANEPEYSENLIKEVNPDYEAR